MGNYGLPPQQPDALHDFTESNTGYWPQISDNQGEQSPRNAPRNLHPLSPDSESWHPQPGFLRQTSGYLSPNANPSSEAPFSPRNYESMQQGFKTPPAVVVDTATDGQGYNANPPPPPPPPLPPLSSPSAAAVTQPWKQQNNRPQVG